MASPVLPGTGESQTGRLRVSGTMRRMVEGQVRLMRSPGAKTLKCPIVRKRERQIATVWI